MSKLDIVLKNQKAELLAELNIKLTDESADRAAEKLFDYFDEIIAKTLVANMTDEDAAKLSKFLDLADPKTDTKDIVAHLPKLMLTLEKKLETEFAKMRLDLGKHRLD